MTTPGDVPFDAFNLDKVLWRRLWSLPDRLVMEFRDLALVEVRDDGWVIFDRLLALDLEQHLLLDHVLPLVLARRGAVVLHGAVLSLQGRAVVLVGPSGAGKSTLSAFAWQHGWTVGGDDGAVLSMSPLSVEPTYATVRLTEQSAGLLGLTLDARTQVVGKRRLVGRDGRAFAQVRLPLAAVAVLAPASEREEATFTRLRGAAGHAALFGSTFHLGVQGAQLQQTMRALAEVADHAVIGRLGVPRGLAGLAAAEQLLRLQVVA